MTSSSNRSLERGLDAMLLVYSLLEGHPVALTALSLSDSLRIDLTDAVLLQTALTEGVPYVATEDLKLTEACQHLGLQVEFQWMLLCGSKLLFGSPPIYLRKGFPVSYVKFTAG